MVLKFKAFSACIVIYDQNRVDLELSGDLEPYVAAPMTSIRAGGTNLLQLSKIMPVSRETIFSLSLNRSKH